RTLNGVAANLRRSIKSLAQHGVAAERLILANAASLSVLNRKSLASTAQKAGLTLDASDIYDRGYFASRLRRDDYWRHELLGLPSRPISLAPVPPDLAESP